MPNQKSSNNHNHNQQQQQQKQQKLPCNALIYILYIGLILLLTGMQIFILMFVVIVQQAAVYYDYDIKVGSFLLVFKMYYVGVIVSYIFMIKGICYMKKRMYAMFNLSLILCICVPLIRYYIGSKIQQKRVLVQLCPFIFAVAYSFICSTIHSITNVFGKNNQKFIMNSFTYIPLTLAALFILGQVLKIPVLYQLNILIQTREVYIDRFQLIVAILCALGGIITLICCYLLRNQLKIYQYQIKNTTKQQQLIQNIKNNQQNKKNKQNITLHVDNKVNNKDKSELISNFLNVHLTKKDVNIFISYSLIAAVNSTYSTYFCLLFQRNRITRAYVGMAQFSALCAGIFVIILSQFVSQKFNINNNKYIFVTGIVSLLASIYIQAFTSLTYAYNTTFFFISYTIIRSTLSSTIPIMLKQINTNSDLSTNLSKNPQNNNTNNTIINIPSAIFNLFSNIFTLIIILLYDFINSQKLLFILTILLFVGVSRMNIWIRFFKKKFAINSNGFQKIRTKTDSPKDSVINSNDIEISDYENRISQNCQDSRKNYNTLQLQTKQAQ